VDIHEGHLSSIFENATEGIILSNSKGEIILINPSGQQMFGYTEKELCGKKIDLLIPTSHREKHEKLRNNFYHSPNNRVMGNGRNLFAVNKEGKNFPVEVSLSHYKKDDSLFVIAFIVDITERKKIEEDLLQQQAELKRISEELNVLNQNLESKVAQRTIILREAMLKLEQSQEELHKALEKERELNDMKSRFVAMASHEFKTPLSTILSSASLIAKYEKKAENEKRIKHIKRIKSAVGNLNDILEDFLNVGKLEDQKVHAALAPMDIKEVLEDMSSQMQSHLKAGQAIHISYDGDTEMYSDRKLLLNILINLVTNSIKFAPESSSIKILYVRLENHLSLSVEDSGIGISKADQAHLFTSFFRGKNALNIQGTGLGLHIVKRYVEILKGNITLKSELGKGTSVSILLPINIPMH